jgi:hypothetical protein
MKTELIYLRFVISENELRMDPDKVEGHHRGISLR